jgi:hypothetical protein
VRQLLLFIALCVGTPAFAATSTTTAPAAAGFWATLGLVYLTRRRAVGGWLLYFYVQLYFSAVVALLMNWSSVGNFEMAKWDSAKLYVWFLLGSVPAICAQFYEVAVATFLLARRSAANLRRMRQATAVMLVTYSATFAIDLAYFQETGTLAMDGMALSLAVVWFFYFRRSTRVQAVFIDKAWKYPEEPAKQPLTAQELRYLHKRAALSGVVTFVALLILMGQVYDKAPDAGLLTLPITYGLLGALCGRYLPMRKGKRAALLAGAVVPEPSPPAV